MTYPSFTAGDVLTASDMNAVGLWKITSGITATNGTVSNGTVTVNATQTSVTVSSCFSADYDAYRIIITNGTASTGGDIRLQLSGSTGSTYSTAGTRLDFGSTTVTGIGPAATTYFTVGWFGTAHTAAVIDLFNPQSATQTGFTSMSGVGYYYSLAGRDTSTAQSTGFTLTTSAGTFSSQKIRVYGHRN